ncbi:MAG: porin family protein [Rhodospirillaceae bacterium]|jgi:opacity protein-like surface antigen|nr:porin family protein [Rhodospirillaceae bacterium]
MSVKSGNKNLIQSVTRENCSAGRIAGTGGFNRTPVRSVVFLAIFLGLFSAPAMAASTLYNMDRLLNEPHPFDTKKYPPPISVPAPIAPRIQSEQIPKSTMGEPSPVSPVIDGLSDEEEVDVNDPLLFSTQASAAEKASPKKFYIAVGVGVTIPNSVDGTTSGGTAYTVNYENGPAFSGAIGYRVNENLRLEAAIGSVMLGLKSLELLGTSVALDGDIDIISYTANVFFDIPTKSGFTPYIGGGVGIASWDIGAITGTVNGTTITSAGGSGTDLTAFGEIGVAFPLYDSVEIVPSYRYQWTDTGTSTLDADTSHAFGVGIRFAF